MAKNRSKILLFGIMALLLPWLWLLPAWAGEEAVVNQSSLNVRAGPGTNHQAVGKLKESERVPVLEKKGDWLKVKLPQGGEGWVAAWLVRQEQVSDPETRPQTSAPAPGKQDRPPISLVVAGRPLSLDVAPYIDQQNRTMVPIRFVSEALGAQVAWVEAAQRVEITAAGLKVELTINNNQVLVNGQAQALDTVPVIKDGRTMVPLRFVSEALGGTVAWQAETQTVAIAPPPAQLPTPPPAPGLNDPPPVQPGSQGGGDGVGNGTGVVRVISGSQVNLRQGPDNNSFPAVAVLGRGQTVEVLMALEQWSKVRTETGQVGWVNNRYLGLGEVAQLPSRSGENEERPRPPEGPQDPNEVRASLPATGQPVAPPDPAANVINLVELRSEGDGLVVVLEGNDLSSYTILTLTQPQRLVLDIKAASLGGDGKGVNRPAGGPLVNAVRTGQFTTDTVRLVLDLQQVVSYAVTVEGGRLTLRVAPPSLAGKVVVLDAGHGSVQPGGWSDPGAIGPVGLYERDVVFDITMKTAELLRAKGASVILTREATSTALGLVDRAQVANSGNADIFISIHANASNKPELNGTAVYYYAPPGTDLGRQREPRQRLAQSIQNEVVRATGLKDLGIREENFSVLRNTLVPSALVETAFISNPDEEKLLADAAFRQKMAAGIAAGITAYLMAAPSPGIAGTNP